MVMHYSIVADTYESMEKTTKRLELTEFLVKLFKETPSELVEKVVYLTQGKLYPDFMGIEIGVADKLAMRTISHTTGITLEKIEELYRETGDIGSTIERVTKSKTQLTLISERLTVERVYDELNKIAKAAGKGSLDIKLGHLSSLLSDASPKEAKYILRTVTGKLRLGIADYTVLDALAIAFTGDKRNRSELERAYNLSSDLGAVAKSVKIGGLGDIRRFSIQVGKPVRPMLAERLNSATDILSKLRGKCASEYKFDGERVQIHKNGGNVCLFSRRLENITSHYPDVVNLSLKYIAARKCISEAEIVAINTDTDEYLPFQELMHRRRKYNIEKAMNRYPIALNFFDLLYVDGKDCTHRSYLERRKILEKAIIAEERVRIVPALITDKVSEVEKFLQEAVTDGCEGLVIKDLNSTYRAGAREFAWIKLKREYRSEITDTVDLVIVGAFYGKGRRTGTYGTLLLAAYDKEMDLFRTVTKVGTGFTDRDLRGFTDLLQHYEIKHRHARVNSRMEADVWFIPQIVIEVIASEITLSPIHSCGMDKIRIGSGLALRFPKYAGKIRIDKAAEDATTTAEIIKMYRIQSKKIEETTVKDI
jgi:DNA ligase-1